MGGAEIGMSMSTLLSVEDFARMIASETEDFELVEGKLVPLASASPMHAMIRQNLECGLAEYFDTEPTGVVLGGVDC